MTSFKKVEKYMSAHVWYTSTIHFISGVGLGILITYPLIGEHPVRWGVALLVLGILGHLAPWFKK